MNSFGFDMKEYAEEVRDYVKSGLLSYRKVNVKCSNLFDGKNYEYGLLINANENERILGCSISLVEGFMKYRDWFEFEKSAEEVLHKVKEQLLESEDLNLVYPELKAEMTFDKKTGKESKFRAHQVFGPFMIYALRNGEYVAYSDILKLGITERDLFEIALKQSADCGFTEIKEEKKLLKIGLKYPFDAAGIVKSTALDQFSKQYNKDLFVVIDENEALAFPCENQNSGRGYIKPERTFFYERISGKFVPYTKLVE